MIILQALDLLQKLRQPGQVIRHSTGTFKNRRQRSADWLISRQLNHTVGPTLLRLY